MQLLQTTRYPVKHPYLKGLIKYFWMIKSDHQVSINHKLLPVSNIDIVLNLSSNIKYLFEGKTQVIPERFHFTGMRNKYCIINQTGRIEVLGIAFYPAGLYSFLKIPLVEFTNRTVDLSLLVKDFVLKLEEKLGTTASIPKRLDILEGELFQLISSELVPEAKTYEIINAFSKNNIDLSIKGFCSQYGINQRRLERIFNNYVGMSPKLFQKLNRFQGVLNQMLDNDIGSLVTLAYENDYYDQNHFIKDFKSFTGSSPSQFLKEKKSVKEILKYDSVFII